MSREKVLKKIEDRAAHSAQRRSIARFLRFVTAFVFLLLFGALLYLTFGEAFHSSDNQVATEQNREELLSQLGESTDSADISFETVMNYTWRFQNGKMASSNAYVENSSNNRNPFYFIVNLSDNNLTPLYVSPVLNPGESINAVKLDTALTAGTYDATLTYFLLNDSDEVADTVNMAVTIVVEK